MQKFNFKKTWDKEVSNFDIFSSSFFESLNKKTAELLAFLIHFALYVPSMFLVNMDPLSMYLLPTFHT